MTDQTNRMQSHQQAEELFLSCINNAFPVFQFRRLELTRYDPDREYLEGTSWNHAFTIWRSMQNGKPVWEVLCRRVSMGNTPDKHVFLDYYTQEILPDTL